MKKYQPIIVSAILILSMICVPVLASNGSSQSSKNTTAQEVFAESPNITVVDQFGIPVSNVKLNVLYEADGDSKNIEVTTPQNGFVPISGKTGTYTFTVSSVPEGYKMTDQKVIQTYQDGATFSGKQITVYRNDDNNPLLGNTNSVADTSGGNFINNPTVNFSTNIALEFRTFIKDIVKEVLQEIENEKQMDPPPSPTPTPQPSPNPGDAPEPTPTPAPLEPSESYIWPVEGYSDLLFHFGDNGDGIFSHGIGIAAPTGTPVKSPGNGKILRAGWNGGGGNSVMIQLDDKDAILFAHLSQYNVEYGQIVNKGDIIGTIGSTGATTTPHLYFAFLKDSEYVNPLDYIKP
ncbi:hypothetical protein DW091_06015 [Eubacterium sp. AM05-23]|nr:MULTISPECIES: peptidoglycan DD-metalloendopeptidase family protein [Eubacterium]RHO59296.1 hypothetical protein DW091_06015 [Eubacterium sp. AM05-23]